MAKSRKIKKAILAGLTAYAASKALGKAPDPLSDKGKSMDHMLKGRKPPMLGDQGKSMDHMVPKKWYEFWKKHGGSVTTAKLGKMIKAKQGTYAREDESIGMRLGAKKTKHDKKVARDESYGDWGNRSKDYAKSGKMIKAKYGTMVRTDGSTPHVPTGGTAYVKTKLNGTLKVKTY